MNKELIRESFGALAPHAEDAMSHFYETLFSAHPEAKPLFARVDMKKQKKKLINSIAHGVEYLDDTDHLADYYRKMGARHVRYGAQPEHYDWVGAALIETFAFFFGENWTEEAQAAWIELYGFIAGEMKKGLQDMVNAKREKKEATISDIAREHAKALFIKALDEELEVTLKELAKEKAREILKKSLEQEARRELSLVRQARRDAA